MRYDSFLSRELNVVVLLALISFWTYQVLYSLLLQVLFFLFIYWYWSYFWRSFSWLFHRSMLWNMVFGIGHLVLMKYFYCLIGSEVTRSGADSEILYQILHLIRQCFLWILNIVLYCYHLNWQVFFDCSGKVSLGHIRRGQSSKLLLLCLDFVVRVLFPF